MVARKDYRPTRPDDSLKRMVDAIQNKKTVPVGTKVAQPDEGYVFYDSTYVAREWNGDAIASFDERLAEGRAAVEAAEAHLAVVEADLADAKERIQASGGDLSAYVDKVAAAQAAADAANASLDAVNRELDAAQADLTGLSSRTGVVESAVADVGAKAAQAAFDAANASDAAQAAQVAAGNAQKTADGKTVVQYGTVTPPPNPGVTKGDTYYYTGTDNRIIETWQWSGTAWVKRKIESAQLANLDAGYITSGYLDVAKRIQTGSIFADKLTIGIGDNIIPNGGGQASDGWSNFSYDNSGAINNNGYGGSFYLTGNSTKMTSLFPAAPGNYRFSVDVKGEGDGQKFYVQVNGYAIDGSRISGPYPVLNQNIPNGVWQTFMGTIALPAGTVKANIGIFSQHSNGTRDDTKRVWYTGFSLREMKDGSLIVNGSITGDKVNAQSVAASVGQFVQVKAGNVEVTGELAARVVNSMSTTTKRLVVTEDALLNNAVFLGNTVAEQLNVTKQLVARDAIVNGTLDVAQLNVTESMAAEIVNAMSINTKKIIVTEDAIMNRLTVIQDIVTPQLVAQRVSSALITGSILQTSTAANTGVKISNDGYKAYSAAGALTVRLDGVNNFVQGELTTNDYGKPRARIYNRVNDTYGTTEAVIDLQASGMAGITTYDKAYGRITASPEYGLTLAVGSSDITRLSLNNLGTTVGGNFYASDTAYFWGDVLPGKAFLNSRGFSAGWGSSSATLSAGAYVDFTVTFSQTMSFVPKVFAVCKNNNLVPLVCTPYQVSTAGCKIRVENVGRASTSGLTMEYVAVCAGA